MSGPHLIIAPKSTLGNWCLELQFFFYYLMIKKEMAAIDACAKAYSCEGIKRGIAEKSFKTGEIRCVYY